MSTNTNARRHKKIISFFLNYLNVYHPNPHPHIQIVKGTSKQQFFKKRLMLLAYRDKHA